MRKYLNINHFTFTSLLIKINSSKSILSKLIFFTAEPNTRIIGLLRRANTILCQTEQSTSTWFLFICQFFFLQICCSQLIIACAFLQQSNAHYSRDSTHQIKLIPLNTNSWKIKCRDVLKLRGVVYVTFFIVHCV